MTSKHTPGPWKIGTKARMQPYIEGADGTPVASCGGDAPGFGCYAVETYRRRDANAAFIVRACNSHDEMLEALKAADRELAFAGHESEWPTRAQIIAAIARAEARS